MRSRLTCVTALCALLGGTTVRAGPPPPCPWDCASVPSGTVDITDFLILISQWGLGTPCDFDDGGVSITDFLTLLAHWGPCPVSGACCDLEGACMVATQDACGGGGGVYAGDGTDCADTDGDRIPTVFELHDCAGAAPCYAGSDPLDPDWVYAIGQVRDRNKPHVNQVNRVVAAFGGARVANPSLVPGIALHIDYGQAPYGGGNGVQDPSGNDTIDFPSLAFDGGEYFAIKPANFAANRNGYFHYCLIDKYSVAGVYQNSSGLGERPGDDFLVSMGQWHTGNHDFIGNTIMHELGHNLNLRHGGDEPRNFKPNYNSVMNYWYQFCGTDLNSDVIPDNGLNYSLDVNIALNEASLVEAAGVTGFGPGIDWNKDGDAVDTLARNINCRLTNTIRTWAWRSFTASSTARP